MKEKKLSWTKRLLVKRYIKMVENAQKEELKIGKYKSKKKLIHAITESMEVFDLKDDDGNEITKETLQTYTQEELTETLKDITAKLRELI